MDVSSRIFVREGVYNLHEDVSVGNDSLESEDRGSKDWPSFRGLDTEKIDRDNREDTCESQADGRREFRRFFESVEVILNRDIFEPS